MPNYPLEWRTNLRVNLVLWPEPAANIVALAARDGDPYDEAQLVAYFPNGEGKDPRAVRQTFEVLALAGLATKYGTPLTFRLTPFGRVLFSFFGIGGKPKFLNPNNRHLLAELFVSALSTVVEYRAIWGLMRGAGDILTNEELNRAMGRTRYLDDVPAAAAAIVEARRSGDQTVIGPRLYEDDKFANAQTRTDQRKAMNPLFLLAGGGEMFISLEQEERRLEDWVVPLIDRRLAEPGPMMHASTDPAASLLLSEYATPPFDVWGTI